MDQWLNNAAALAYVDRVWVVINNKGEAISWTEDPIEAAWLSDWILGIEAEKQRQAKFTKERAPVLRERSRVTEPGRGSRRTVVPIGRP